MIRETTSENSRGSWFIRHTVGRYMDIPSRLLNPTRVFGKIVPMLLQHVPFPSTRIETATYPEAVVERVNQLRTAA